MWATITREEARKTLASFRKVKDLWTLEALGGKLATVFGVKPLAGFLEEDYRYTFGALPVSPETGGQACLLLDITAAGKSVKLAFSPGSVRTLMEVSGLLLLAAARPIWLGDGHLMNVATLETLVASGNVTVDLTDETIRRELGTYGTIVVIADSLVPR